MDELTKNKNGGARLGAGRPKKIVEDAKQSVLLELFNADAERIVVQNIIDIASTKSQQAVQSATWLWDRKYGKVTDKTETKLFVDVTQLSDDELERLVNPSGSGA